MEREACKATAELVLETPGEKNAYNSVHMSHYGAKFKQLSCYLCCMSSSIIWMMGERKKSSNVHFSWAFVLQSADFS